VIPDFKIEISTNVEELIPIRRDDSVLQSRW